MEPEHKEPENKEISVPAAEHKAAGDTPVTAHVLVEKKDHSQENDLAAKTGRFLYRNRDSIEGPLGWFTIKQVTRSLIASAAMMSTAIPVLHAFEWLESRNKHLKTIGKITEEQMAHRNMFLGAPFKPIAYVAAGFSMYRGTTKIFNKAWDKLFKKENDEDKTIDEVRNIGHTLKEAVREVAPAEFQSTPFGAVALGGLRSVFPAASIHSDYTLPSRDDIKKMGGRFSESWWQRAKNVITTAGRGESVGGKFKSAYMAFEVPLNWLGYFTFFELSDRLYKDVQLRRGIWKGDANSINGLWRGVNTNRPEGEPETHGKDGKVIKAAVVQGSDNDVLLTTFQRNDRLGTFTNDPSFSRLILRNLPPVLVGIGSYLPLNKLSKMITGQLEAPEYGKGFGANLKKFGHNFKAEWAAIGMFFTYAMSKELWEKWYDQNLCGVRMETHLPQKKHEEMVANAANQNAADKKEAVKPAVHAANQNHTERKADILVNATSVGDAGMGSGDDALRKLASAEDRLTPPGALLQPSNRISHASDLGLSQGAGEQAAQVG